MRRIISQAFATLFILGAGVGVSNAEVVGARVERVSPTSVRISWTTTAPGEAIDVYLAATPDAPHQQRVSRRDRDGEHLIEVDASARSYFVLRPRHGRSVHAAETLLPLEGGQNFRDIGGYRTADGRRVRWGLVYRAASLTHLSDGDYRYIAQLGIRTVYDLRSVEERQAEPTQWRIAPAPRQLVIDYSQPASGAEAALFAGGMPTPAQVREIVAKRYPELLESQVGQQREVFANLLRGEGPMLYHCSAGKDRTGLVTALFLAALGVPREIIIADFELSNEYYRADTSSPAYQAYVAALGAELTETLSGVDGSYLRATFQHIDREYGGVEGFLQQAPSGERRRYRAVAAALPRMKRADHFRRVSND